jgi:hypothetical protein
LLSTNFSLYHPLDKKGPPSVRTAKEICLRYGQLAKRDSKTDRSQAIWRVTSERTTRAGARTNSNGT